MHLETSKEIKSAIAKNFSLAANTYQKTAILQQEIGFRLLERLDFIKIHPTLLLDLGAGVSFLSNILAKKYPKAHVISLDIAEGSLHYAKKYYPSAQQLYICADGEYCPIKSQSMDFIFSNCSLAWFFNPKKVLAEIYRILKPGGSLLFSTFGPDTLKELRTSTLFAQPKNTFIPLLDMHDMGDILLQTEFLNPVMDRETLTLTYKNLKGLLKDLKQTGNHFNIGNTTLNNPKTTWHKLIQAYEHYRTNEGLLPATFEVIYGYATVGTDVTLHRLDDDGIIRIPADHLHHL